MIHVPCDKIFHPNDLGSPTRSSVNPWNTSTYTYVSYGVHCTCTVVLYHQLCKILWILCHNLVHFITNQFLIGIPGVWCSVHLVVYYYMLQKRKEELLSVERNQKLGLCHALLELGDWGGASSLMKLLPPSLPMWSPVVSKSLCLLIHLSVEPVYKRSVAHWPGHSVYGYMYWWSMLLFHPLWGS